MKTISTRALMAAGVLACGILSANSADAAVAGQLGVLDINGINPATGVQWAEGDTYRLIFVSSATTTATSTDIATYNSFVQGLATTAGYGSVDWTVVASTAATNARDNTGTSVSDGVGEAIVLMDGSTIIADNYADLWDGGIEVTVIGGGDPLVDAPRGIYLDETGADVGADDRVFTGTNSNGTTNTDQPLGNAGNVSTGAAGAGFPTQFWGYNAGTNESGRWTQDFSFSATGQQEVYGISETLTVVPEPTSLALLGLGGLMIARRRRG